MLQLEIRGRQLMVGYMGVTLTPSLQKHRSVTFLRNVKLDNGRKVRIKEIGPGIWTTGFWLHWLHYAAP